MYLKSLELHGFKSFPNRTVLTFERGATVIVGPNGSGKSNISDAMRWVLGERNSRNIRGTKMEDVIFGGTDDRRPMGFAEVSITFDNTDPDNRLDIDTEEVTVTRRYYRTGESEYLINRESKRLKDIYSLFLDTGVGREGYSVIGQGKVQEIVGKKSEERRHIFEEASGIAKYRERKEATESKLKATSENLDRLNDIRLELESRVGPLAKEAEKARQGLAIYEEKKRADVSLWLYDTKKILEDIEEAEKAWRLAEHELDIVRQILSDLEAQSETLYTKSILNKQKSEDLLTEIQRTTTMLHDLDRSMRAADFEFTRSLELIEDCNKRISEIESSIATLNGNKEQYLAKKASIDEVVAELSDIRFGYLTEQQELSDQIDAMTKEIEDALDDLRVEEGIAAEIKARIEMLTTSSASDGTKTKDIEAEIAEYEKTGEQLRIEAEKCEEATREFRIQIDEKESIIAENTEKIDSLTEEKAQISESLGEMRVQKDALLQRADALSRMNEHFDGYYDSVKFVMREFNAGNIEGEIYGPLSTIISVEKNYVTAIDMALGASLQNIVVDTDQTAKAAMKALKRANAGRITFYPISTIRVPNESEESKAARKMPGFIGRADTLVGVDKKYRSIIEFLLLRTLVFDNIDNANEAAKKIGYKVKMVTLDGQVINAGGSFTGGSAKRDSGLLSRVNEINELNTKSTELGKRISEMVEALAEIESELKEAESLRKLAEEDKEVLLSLSRSKFAAYDNATAKYEANKNIIDKFRQDYDNLVSGKAKAEEEIVRLGYELEETYEKIEAYKEFRIRRQTELYEVDDKREEVVAKANETNVRIAESKKEIEGVMQFVTNIDERIAELEEEKRQQQIRIDSLNAKREGIDSTKSERSAEYEALEARFRELTDERREVEEGGNEYEREMNNVRIQIKEKTASNQTLFEYATKTRTTLDKLLEKQAELGSQLYDDYEMSYEDAVSMQYPPVTEENREEVAKVQAQCKSKLRSIGNFNPKSIEEYAEVKSRYDYMNTQYIDLTKSKDELIEIINRIEREMRSSFVEAFNAINKNFAITFRDLFGGGNAELSLTDPTDVLTSGIEIKAAPPGKIIKSMSLLSGGEQSFVAIALLFAILKVNPTPFCILDEIEAALDEVNVFRFGEYVKRLSEDTQFILITHRRGTMEIGDRLYGVTMPQRGISQCIELNVNEIEGKQKELLDGVL